MKILSHIKRTPDGWVIQSNEAHADGVAERARLFAGKFNMEGFGYAMGKLHDKGKESPYFQQHIAHTSGYAPTIQVEGPSEHAYIGGLVAKELFPREHCLFSNAIMGHHRGLYDHGDWKSKLNLPLPEFVSTENLEADLRIKCPQPREKDIHHLERVLFSCLVDADYLDTEAFMKPEQSELRGHGESLDILLAKLEDHLCALKQNSRESEVNRVRNTVQAYCRSESDRRTGYYSLTVPTGGGKTLSSVLWALRHATRNKLERIVIAIPYTSIIIQTAAVLKKIFGAENVLEHHSEANGGPPSESTKMQLLATENWDYPIVVTTNVQLFESMFNNKPSACRKLHNLVNSVIILDEAQTLPTAFLNPIVDALDTYHRIFNCSVLFTTASQPTLAGERQGVNPSITFHGLPSLHEIIPHAARLHDKLRRVRLSFDEEPCRYDEIAQRLATEDRVLCIVNTRKDAREIYDRLPKEGICLHLSRMMCPAHIRSCIRMLKEALKDNGNRIIRVVATQLIEAGVDIDFPVVYRQEAGLDSILQAAGRCNREGRLPLCTTYVFSLQKEHPLPTGYMTQTNNARINMGQGHDWFSQDAMDLYFKNLYARVYTFDKEEMERLLYRPDDLQFETASERFCLIDDTGTSIVVNWENSMDLVKEWQQYGPSYSIQKQISQYTVTIRGKDWEELKRSGSLLELSDGLYCLEDASFYLSDVGLVAARQWLEEILIA